MDFFVVVETLTIGAGPRADADLNVVASAKTIPVIVISLERSLERRCFMRAQLEGLGLPFRFLDAVDGREMSAETLMRAAPGGGSEYNGLLTPGEVGCALSHLAAIRQIAEGEEKFGAVIEDDAALLPEARKFFDPGLLRALPSFDVLQLGDTEKNWRLRLNLAKVGKHQVRAWPTGRFNMTAVIYTREGARSIIASIQAVTAPIDNMIFRTRPSLGLRVLGIRPAVVGQAASLTSEIGGRPRPKGLGVKTRRELRRFRNWIRRWGSFVRLYGLSGVLGLRLN